MKEHIALHRNRPFAICSASDLNLEHHGTILDEDIALKMRFPIRQLQYVRLSLKTDSSNECTRTVGVTRCTIQTISHGRPDRSVSFVARVVRDLHQLTGAEALADANLMKRLRPNMKVEKELEIEELERKREIAIPSDMDVMGHSDTGSAISQDNAGQFYSDSDIDHWARCDTSWPVKPVSLNRQDRDISSCGSDDDASSYGTDDSRTDRDVSSRGSDSATSYGTDDSRGAADRAWREMTGQDILDDNSSCGSAHIRKVRGRNKKDKPADLARAQMGEERWKEFVEEFRKKDAENSKNSEASQYALLDKTFPGGAVAAHRALARVLERDGRKKEKEAFEVRKRRKKLIWDVVAAYHPRADADGKPSEEKENCVRYTGSQYPRHHQTSLDDDDQPSGNGSGEIRSKQLTSAGLEICSGAPTFST